MPKYMINASSKLFKNLSKFNVKNAFYISMKYVLWRVMLRKMTWNYEEYK